MVVLIDLELGWFNIDGGLIEPELGELNIDGGPDRSGVRWVKY